MTDLASAASFKHVLVPTDFSAPSEHALDVAVELAQELDCALTLLHVYELPSYAYYSTVLPTDLVAAPEIAARKQLNEVEASLRARLPRARVQFVAGKPWSSILSAIEKDHADLVVMGTHGRGGFTHALLGSVAEKIVRMSPVPVLTVRAR